jgi:hypothetical protein
VRDVIIGIDFRKYISNGSAMKTRQISETGKEKIRINGYNEWLDNALHKHKDRFDYTNVLRSFKTQKAPLVEIICKKHDERINITPFNHLRSLDGGCKHCELDTTGSQSRERESAKFNAWFKEHRSDVLEIRSEFLGMTSDMQFYCKKHDFITITKPTYLMVADAYGCEKCSREATSNSGLLTLDKVRNDLGMDFPDHVQIIGVTFDQDKRQSLVRINCDYHGEQSVSKGTLKRSYYKCPRCGDDATGFAGNRLRTLVERGEKGRATYLGVMDVEVFDILSLKVGVTTRTLDERYKWHLKKIHFSVQMSELDAYILENRIHREFVNNHDLRILKAGMRNKERWGGDTECYWYDRKDDIIRYIQNYFSDLSPVNYREEVEIFEIPNFFPRDASREKSEANLPIAIVGIDPVTNAIVKEYSSFSEARNEGYVGVSKAIYDKSGRRLAGKLRWFKKSEFDPENIPILLPRSWKSTAVECIELDMQFDSVISAERYMLSIGKKVNGSHISSVCSGKRKSAGGFRWKYIV